MSSPRWSWLFFVLAAGSLLAGAAVPATAQYPLIESLSRDDPLFLQHAQGIAEFYRTAGNADEFPSLLLYEYEREPDESLFGIAARLSLPYSSIATINRLSSPEIGDRARILVPSIPGVYVPVLPDSDLERIMADLRKEMDAIVVTVRDGEITPFRFFPGEDFLPEERIGFLSVLFRHPLPGGDLTSPYGLRPSPFSSQITFHGGVDYAAAEGTAVLAARSGAVDEISYNDILGNYVILRHSGGFRTLYGHLQSTAVTLNQEVRSGMMLGTVGSTGLVTGPHLHFEIRQSGRTRDPETMLR